MTKTLEKLYIIDFTKEFWKTLSSRDEWKKSFIVLQKKYLKKMNTILVKFIDYNIVTPSYLDETVLEISRLFPGQLYVDKTTDSFIKESIDYLSKYRSVQVCYK